MMRSIFSMLIVCLVSGFVSPADAADIAPATHTDSGFRIPQPGYDYRFPRDHGSHPQFAIEWWYVTGHLSSSEREFGFQLTFFRLAQELSAENAESASGAFQNDQLHLAHASLSDISEQRFYHEERLNREGWDASAQVGDLDLRNGNWRLTRNADDSLSLSASVRSDVQLDLRLKAEKAPVIFGENGVSQKSSDPTASSHYITFTRLGTEGSLRVNGEPLEVRGSSWMDHEISSSQLAADQVGWDWVSIQLNDGREVMAYVLRRDDGSYEPASSLSWIDRDGHVEAVKLDQFDWQADGFWTSPASGARYPLTPKLSAIDPESQTRRSFQIQPLIKNQEVNGKVSGMAYWEGACAVLDEAGTVIGKAYLELAGYKPGLKERLRGR